MTFKDLIKSHTWPTIASLFLEIYPEAEKNIKGFKTVFEKLTGMDPEETEMSIVITREKDEADGEEYVEVSGLYNNPKDKEEQYAQGLEFTPWRQWLGMDIHKESVADFSEPEIIIHCLYEMTFVGFSEENIQKKISSIEKSREERESLTEEERDAITASVEQLLTEWRDDDGDQSKHN